MRSAEVVSSTLMTWSALNSRAICSPHGRAVDGDDGSGRRGFALWPHGAAPAGPFRVSRRCRPNRKPSLGCAAKSLALSRPMVQPNGSASRATSDGRVSGTLNTSMPCGGMYRYSDSSPHRCRRFIAAFHAGRSSSIVTPYQAPFVAALVAVATHEYSQVCTTRSPTFNFLVVELPSMLGFRCQLGYVATRSHVPAPAGTSN